MTARDGATRAYVHKLVLLAFVGPRPKGMQCRHLDGDPGNNSAPKGGPGTNCLPDPPASGRLSVS